MSQYVETATKTFTAGGAIAQHLLVKTPGALAKAGIGDEFIGSLEDAAFASGDVVAVRLRSAQGTMKCVAAGAFSAEAVVYGRANGTIDDIASAAVRVGIALEAATAAGDIVEVMPC